MTPPGHDAPDGDTELLGPETVPAVSGPSFPIGQRLGKYVVVGQAGSGGMSVVLRAHDTELDRRVALKLLRVGTLGAAARARLAREAQALARLSHPNVVPVYDLCTVDAHAFLAMEYVEGKTFAAWLKTPRTVREVLAVVIAAGRGLAAAHAAGLIHRDVKPSNILVGADGRVRIVDFGLARSATSLSRHSLPTPSSSPGDEPSRELPMVTRDDQVVGTPAFMAPEQARGADVDARTDQFSLGVTLFYALYDELPFAQGDASGVHTTQQSAAPVFARRTSPHGNVPAHIHATMSRMLELEPARRFATLGEALSQLERDPRKTQRRVLAVAATLGLIGVAGVGWLRDGQGDPCSHGDERVATAWSPARASKVRKAYLDTRRPDAARAANFVLARLDAYAKEWTRAYTDSCAATQVRRDQSSEVMDLRMACLDARLDELNAVGRALEHSTAAQGLGQSDPVAAFTPIAACHQVTALRDVDPEPAQQRGTLHSIRALLATAKAQHAVGQSAEALATLDPLRAQADATHYDPLRAEVSLWSGRAAANLSNTARAMAEFARATELGIGSRADATAIEAALRLAQEHLYDAGSPSHGARYADWFAVAQGLLRRHPNEHRLHDIAKRLECSSLWERGEFKERAVCLTELLETAKREQRDDHWLYTMHGLGLVDVARYAEGIASQREGLRRVAVELGDEHPLVAEDYGLLCGSLADAGFATEAHMQCQEGLKRAVALGPDAVEHVPQLELYLARTLDLLGRTQEALALAQKAAASSNAFVAVNALAQIAKIELKSGDETAGLAHLREVLAKHVEQLGSDVHPVLFDDQVALAFASLAHHPDEARTHADRALKMAETLEVPPLSRIEARIILAEVAAATGNLEQARSLAQTALAELAAQEDTPRARALIRRARRASEAHTAVNVGAAQGPQ